MVNKEAFRSLSSRLPKKLHLEMSYLEQTELSLFIFFVVVVVYLLNSLVKRLLNETALFHR